MLNKERLLAALEGVITTSEGERKWLDTNKEFMSNAQLELSKTRISANKNIVSAVSVATKLIDDNGKK